VLSGMPELAVILCEICIIIFSHNLRLENIIRSGIQMNWHRGSVIVGSANNYNSINIKSACSYRFEEGHLPGRPTISRCELDVTSGSDIFLEEA
jgi:hypothetical protein